MNLDLSHTPPLRILVVDDNDDAADVLGLALEALGHEAVIAHNGEEALRCASSRQHDLALLDIGLPTMDGYELAEELGARLGPHCPKLVALTGYGHQGARDRSEAAGFVEHLVKPIDLAGIRKLLSDLFPGR